MTGFIIALVIIVAIIVAIIAVAVGWVAINVFPGVLLGVPLILIGLWALTSWGDMAGIGIIPLIIGGLFLWSNFAGGLGG